MKTNFKLKNKTQTLNIFPLGDIHVGSTEFNENFLHFWVKQFKKCHGQKCIYLLGDLVDCAKKSISNSTYKQQLSPNEQLDYIIKLLNPYKKYIRGAVIGNHEARLQKEFDLNFTKILCSSLEIPYYTEIYEPLTINDKTYTIYGIHGTKNSTQLHLMLGQFQRQTSHINANLYLMGHTHKCANISDVERVSDGYKRKHYVLTGSFLNYEESYAQDMLLKPVLPSFPKISIDENCRTKIELYHLDEVKI